MNNIYSSINIANNIYKYVNIILIKLYNQSNMLSNITINILEQKNIRTIKFSTKPEEFIY